MTNQENGTREYSHWPSRQNILTGFYRSQAEVQLISVAWKCARGTYDLEGTVTDTGYCTFRRDQVVDSSFAGTVKLITSTIIEAKTGSRIIESLPVLVLAIRGSASKMDHIVNANAQPRTTESFIVSSLSLICL